MLQKYKELEDLISILGLEELSDQDKKIVNKVRKVERFLSQPLFVAEIFTRISGRYVCLINTLLGFIKIISGNMDLYFEGKFYLKGNLQDVFIK